MKKVVPYLRILFLALFVALLFSGKLLLWLVLYGVSLLIPLVFGKRFYCTLMCPINTAMSGIVSVKKKRGQKDRPTPAWLTAKWLPWATLALTAVLFILFRVKMGKPMPVMLLWIFLAVVMTLFYHQDVFHDGVCPYGTLQGMLAKVSFLSPINRHIARNYQGFTTSVLAGNNKKPSA